MTENKKYSLGEIHEIANQNDGMIDCTTADVIAIRKESADRYGTYIWRMFKKEPDGTYFEVQFEEKTEEMAEFLAKHVTAKAIIKEVLQKIDSKSFYDLLQRVEKKPKVTAGIQKGSCVNLYVRGKKGAPASLQLTE